MVEHILNLHPILYGRKILHADNGRQREPVVQGEGYLGAGHCLFPGFGALPHCLNAL